MLLINAALFCFFSLGASKSGTKLFVRRGQKQGRTSSGYLSFVSQLAGFYSELSSSCHLTCTRVCLWLNMQLAVARVFLFYVPPQQKFCRPPFLQYAWSPVPRLPWSPLRLQLTVAKVIQQKFSPKLEFFLSICQCNHFSHEALQNKSRNHH